MYEVDPISDLLCLGYDNCKCVNWIIVGCPQRISITDLNSTRFTS